MPARPNILIFMTDQEQGQVVEPGHPCKTPNADRLAAEGVRFRHCYTPSPHCCPSRATFFTGLYPSRHGIYNNIFNSAAIHTELNPGVITFGEQLREVGYRTIFSGKWHVSAAENPSDRGWTELVTTATKGTNHGRTIEDWRRDADAYTEEGERQRGHIQRPGWGDFVVYDTLPDAGPKGYEDSHDYKVVSRAVGAIHDLQYTDDSWALFVGPVGPHDPFNVPKKFVDMYNPADIELPESYRDTLEDKPRLYQRMRRQLWDQLTEDEVRESIAHYWAFCTMQDAMLGEVLDALDATGQAANTLVVFLSDHGDYCGAHGLYLKGVPAFREAYHVPCIMRWPKGIPNPGREIDAIVTLADFAPTFLELAEIEPPDDLTGNSLLPVIQGRVPTWWPDALYTQCNGVELYYSQRAVMTHEFKYVYNGFDFDELYDLRNDPHEMVNVAEDPAYTEIKKELVGKMWRFAAKENDIIFNPYGTVGLAPWGPAEGLRS
ncbi:sulfatase-like hydrolase/transferase [bacterium]|nr:sulfatase-like hydrolase/transferase [bacterium]